MPVRLTPSHLAKIMTTNLFKKTWPLLLFFLGIILWPGLVQAHSGLVRSDPPDLCTSLQAPFPLPPQASCDTGVILPQAPTTVHLWFSEPVQVVRHSITVISPSGKSVAQGTIQNNGTDLSIAINAPELGIYQVRWQVISEDTHPVTGNFNFSVDHATPTTSRAQPALIGSVSLLGFVLQGLARLLHFTGYVLAFGSLIFWLVVLRPLPTALVVLSVEPPVADSTSEKLPPQVIRLIQLGIILLLLAEPLALFGQTSSLNSSQIFDLDLIGDSLSSSFGRLLAQRVGAAFLLWVLLGTVTEGSKHAPKVMLGLGVILALVDGQGSHAVSSGSLVVGLVANTIHIVAMAAWLGGLITLLAVWKLAALEKQHSHMVSRFGRLALIAVLWLAASGLVMAYLHLGQLADLWNTDYGKVLLLKLVALGIALLLATQAILRAGINRSHWWRFEAGTLTLVVFLAGLLITLPAPA